MASVSRLGLPGPGLAVSRDAASRRLARAPSSASSSSSRSRAPFPPARALLSPVERKDRTRCSSCCTCFVLCRCRRACRGDSSPWVTAEATAIQVGASGRHAMPEPRSRVLAASAVSGHCRAPSSEDAPDPELLSLSSLSSPAEEPKRAGRTWSRAEAGALVGGPTSEAVDPGLPVDAEPFGTPAIAPATASQLGDPDEIGLVAALPVLRNEPMEEGIPGHAGSPRAVEVPARRLRTSLRIESDTGPEDRSACSMSVASSASSAALALVSRSVTSERDARSRAARCCSYARDSSDVAKTLRCPLMLPSSTGPECANKAALDTSWMPADPAPRDCPRSVSPNRRPISSILPTTPSKHVCLWWQG